MVEGMVLVFGRERGFAFGREDVHSMVEDARDMVLGFGHGLFPLRANACGGRQNFDGHVSRAIPVYRRRLHMNTERPVRQPPRSEHREGLEACDA